VDDDPLVLDFIQSALEDGGFHVDTALSGPEALELLGRGGQAYAGVVTDVNLGEALSGWDVGKAARELNPRIALVYISGDSGHQWSVSGVPMSIMIEKPFAPAQLITAIATLINDMPTGDGAKH
jgi:CheY-like chemotaxis protein